MLWKKLVSLNIYYGWHPNKFNQTWNMMQTFHLMKIQFNITSENVGNYPRNPFFKLNAER